jgi:hypothetical protein
MCFKIISMCNSDALTLAKGNKLKNQADKVQCCIRYRTEKGILVTVRNWGTLMRLH